MLRRWLAIMLVTYVAAARALGDPSDEPNPPTMSARTQKRVEWYQHAVLDAFEKNGSHSSMWDAPARQTLEAAVRSWSRSPDLDRDEHTIMWTVGDEAAMHGCNDGMFRYAMARNFEFFDPDDAEGLEQFYSDAANYLRNSQYPAVFKAWASLAAAKFSYKFAPKPITPAEAAHEKELVDTALGLVPQIGADANIPPDVLIALMDEVGETSVTIEQDRWTYFNRADRALQGTLKDQSLLLTLEGTFQVQYAWDARGNGFGHTVTADGAALFQTRLENGGDLLKQAWDTDHSNSIAAARRITVAMGLGQPQTEMERWFKRAIAADPDSVEACDAKMRYLLPRWNGREEDAVGFGRECMATNRWKTLLPQELINAWDWSTFDGLTHEKLARADAWEDIRAVCRGFIDSHPGSKYWRSKYASYAWLGGHWADADGQFKLLGNNFSGEVFLQADFEQQKGQSEQKAREAAARAVDKITDVPPPTTRPSSGMADPRLDDAKREYADQLQDAKNKLQEAYNAAINSATTRGDTDSVSQLTRERDAALLDGIPPLVEDAWTIMFRSVNPFLFNTPVSNAKSYSLPASAAPSAMKYLRLRRMDTKEYVIIPLTSNMILANGSSNDPYWWRGDKCIDAQACHLGITDQRAASSSNVIMAMEPDGNRTGWGFGRTIAGDRQAYVWRGVELDPTVFEFAVTTRELTADEQSHLLK